MRSSLTFKLALDYIVDISSPFCSYEWIAGCVEDDEAGLIRLRRLGEKVEILTATKTTA
jgi:hypothetical protein